MLQDVRVLDPTLFVSPSIVWQRMFDLHQRQQASNQAELDAQPFSSTVIGKRLKFVSTGASTTPFEVLEFMRLVFFEASQGFIGLNEGFGATECGGVLVKRPFLSSRNLDGQTKPGGWTNFEPVSHNSISIHTEVDPTAGVPKSFLQFSQVPVEIALKPVDSCPFEEGVGEIVLKSSQVSV